jgi:integrase
MCGYVFPSEICFCDSESVTICDMSKTSASRSAVKGIYRRGKIYWFAKMVAGKRNFVSLETEDLAEAVRRAQDLRDNPVLESGDLVVHAVDRYVKFCVLSGEWTMATERSKGYVLKKWAEKMGRVTPRQIRTEMVRAWHAERLKSVVEATAYGNLMTLQGFFHWAKDTERLCSSNPVKPLTDRKATTRIRCPEAAARRDYCTHELRDRLIEECEREDLKFVLYCGFHAGLRFAEIVEARRFWFDLDAGLLHLRKHEGIRFKDREERTVPLTAGFKAYLKEREWPDDPQGYMLHPEIEGRRKNIYRWDFGLPFRNYMAQQQCEWVTPHIMRHTFASLLASAGVSIFKVAQWMGDEVRVVERHYAKLIPNDSEIDRAFSVRLPREETPCPPRKPASKRPGNRRSRKA